MTFVLSAHLHPTPLPFLGVPNPRWRARLQQKRGYDGMGGEMGLRIRGHA